MYPGHREVNGVLCIRTEGRLCHDESGNPNFSHGMFQVRTTTIGTTCHLKVCPSSGDLLG